MSLLSRLIRGFHNKTAEVRDVRIAGGERE